MKAYMWRRRNGEWLYMVGFYRNVAEARERWQSGGRMANVPYAYGLNNCADIARAHAARAATLWNDPDRDDYPLAA